MSKSKDKHHSPTAEAEKSKPLNAGQPAAVDTAAAGPAAATEPAAPKPEAPADVPTLCKVGTMAGRPADAKATEELAQLKDRLLRLQADFDNFRKRTLREKTELFDSANQALMLELLPVLDHLHLGIKAAADQQADPAFREGLTMIFDQLQEVLSKFGLSPIETEGQAFDPNRFEAVNTLPSESEPEGTVLASVRRGYMLRNKLLRPAQVIVSSGAPKPALEAAPPENFEAPAAED